MLVYIVYFTLYVHDCTVCAHAVLESGVKGIYTNGKSSVQRESDVEQDLKQKLSERLLWIKEEEIDVKVNPVQLQIQVNGTGVFLPVKEVQIEQCLYRLHPCETIRRSRWLRK